MNWLNLRTEILHSPEFIGSGDSHYNNSIEVGKEKLPIEQRGCTMAPPKKTTRSEARSNTKNTSPARGVSAGNSAELHRSREQGSDFKMTTKRVAIGKALRFSVFSRDNFTCRYCGRQSDTIPLHVDHVIPVCQGGTNDIENLITACSDCNLGKSGKTIPQSAPTEADRLRLAQERNEQLDAANAAASAAKARAELRQTVCDYYCKARGKAEMQSSELNTLVSYVTRHGAELVFEWIDSAVRHVSQFKSDAAFGRYISGCRRRWMEENADAE